jgi:hypothetical protein
MLAAYSAVDLGRARTEMLNLLQSTRALKMEVPMVPLAYVWNKLKSFGNTRRLSDTYTNDDDILD